MIRFVRSVVAVMVVRFVFITSVRLSVKSVKARKSVIIAVNVPIVGCVMVKGYVSMVIRRLSAKSVKVRKFASMIVNVRSVGTVRLLVPLLKSLCD